MKTLSKEQTLIDRIEKAKQALGAFREQRKLEIGQLAYQCGIAELPNDMLKAAFLSLASTHKPVNTNAATDNV